MSSTAHLNPRTHGAFPVITEPALERVVSAVDLPLSTGFSAAALRRHLDDIATMTIHILLSPDPKGLSTAYRGLLHHLEEYERGAAKFSDQSIFPFRLPEEWLARAREPLLAVAQRRGGRWRDRHAGYFFPRMAGLLAAAFATKPTSHTGSITPHNDDGRTHMGAFARFVRATQLEMQRYLDGFEDDERWTELKRLLAIWSQTEPDTFRKQLSSALKQSAEGEPQVVAVPESGNDAIDRSSRSDWKHYCKMYRALSGLEDGQGK